MVYPLGLNATEMAELYDALLRPHSLDVELQMMDLDHNNIGDFSHRLLSGSVNIDTTADVTRSLQLTLFDPDRSLNLDKDNPYEGSMYLDRMVQVRFCVSRLGTSRRFEIPVFTGPINKLSRDGVILTVECQGKEIMSRNNSWAAKTFGKGWLRHRLIRHIMSEYAGETRFKFTPSTSKTASPTAITRELSLFSVARSLAAGARMRLYYDGAGYLRLVKNSTKPVFTFDNRSLLSVPQVGWEIGSDFVNAVDVTGKKEKKKAAPRFRAVAPRSHPLSPWSLKRGGVPRYVGKFILDDKLKTVADCKRVATAELNRGLLESVDASFNAVVIPFLEEGDPYRVETDEYVAHATVRQLTIPLVGSESMAVGYLKNVRPSRLTRTLQRK